MASCGPPACGGALPESWHPKRSPAGAPPPAAPAEVRSQESSPLPRESFLRPRESFLRAQRMLLRWIPLRMPGLPLQPLRPVLLRPCAPLQPPPLRAGRFPCKGSWRGSRRSCAGCCRSRRRSRRLGQSSKVPTQITAVPAMATASAATATASAATTTAAAATATASAFGAEAARAAAGTKMRTRAQPAKDRSDAERARASLAGILGYSGTPSARNQMTKIDAELLKPRNQAAR